MKMLNHFYYIYAFFFNYNYLENATIRCLKQSFAVRHTLTPKTVTAPFGERWCRRLGIAAPPPPLVNKTQDSHSPPRAGLIACSHSHATADSEMSVVVRVSLIIAGQY
ncbi:unnamed protein product [Citrullus colocynthis]|uniref:Secreted protein n=1 Tax=Citrullus colocynthis TaxID=252529 RepID=A0ABP0XKK6_9ROSI